MTDLATQGAVLSVASDPGHHFSKHVKDSIMLVKGHGVEGDAHAGPFVRHRYLARRQPRRLNLRQVHLIPAELLCDLGQHGYEVKPGELGENITTRGLALEQLPLGTLLVVGDTAVIELTGLRTPCVLIDRFQTGLKRQMICSVPDDPPFRCGVLGVVTDGGRVAVGDPVRVALPRQPWQRLPPL
jgi:hypothetical protein